MTDKEWKELCEWAKNLQNKKVTVSKFTYEPFEEHITLDLPRAEILIFYKSGEILGAEDYIAYNRTPEQIKAIITNLL